MSAPVNRTFIAFSLSGFRRRGYITGVADSRSGPDLAASHPGNDAVSFSVVLPTLNETANLPYVFDRLPERI
jgi:hypothetical protein